MNSKVYRNYWTPEFILAQIVNLISMASKKQVAAIVLAAGGSRRFGSPKQLAPWQGKTFIEQIVDTALASQASPVIVVLGAKAERCRQQLGTRPIQIVVNDCWAKGQSTSMKAGLSILSETVDAALFLLVDQPLITSDIINTLIEGYQRSQSPLVWPEFEGRRGNPVLFDRALFPEMQQVEGDIGARPVLMRWRDQAERVSVDDMGILQDFDRPQELSKVAKRQGGKVAE